MKMQTIGRRLAAPQHQPSATETGGGSASSRPTSFSEFAQHLARLLPSEQEACRFADYLVEFSGGDEEECSNQQKVLVQNLLTQAADLYSIGGMTDRANAVAERLANLTMGGSHGS
jgi:hypothetical protein